MTRCLLLLLVLSVAVLGAPLRLVSGMIWCGNVDCSFVWWDDEYGARWHMQMITANISKLWPPGGRGFYSDASVCFVVDNDEK